MAALSNLKQCPPFSTLPDLALRHNHIPELERYPQINLNHELLAHPAGQRFYGGQSFVPVDEGVLKRITRTFFRLLTVFLYFRFSAMPLRSLREFKFVN